MRSALPAFALSRALVAWVLFVTLRLPGIVAGAPPAALASRGDASWYLEIARFGYEARPFDAAAQHDWAFFPLYPLLLRAAAWLTGEWPLTGVALSSTFFLVGLALVHELALAAGVSDAVARRAALVTALWPSSSDGMLRDGRALRHELTEHRAGFRRARPARYTEADLCPCALGLVHRRG